MPDLPSRPVDPASTSETGPDAARRCVACGYNLYGLGDEPRCPECGLLSIPSSYRREVWELVDSGKWFFSRFFGPFRKRPPGWWWALDRPGDLKRSIRFGAASVLVTAILMLAAGSLASSVRVEITDKWSNLSHYDADDPARSTIVDLEQVHVLGVGGLPRGHRLHRTERKHSVDRRVRPLRSTSIRVLVVPSFDFLPLCGVIFLWVFFIWAGPAVVGLWTQIRKGLPEFARAPRTIIAACNYESHRLLYLGIVVVTWVVIDTALRLSFARSWPTTPGKALLLVGMSWGFLLPCLTVFGAAGWIGPLRSDYTQQLVRSRGHAARILIMYAVVLPWVMTIIVAGAVQLLLGL